MVPTMENNRKIANMSDIPFPSTKSDWVKPVGAPYLGAAAPSRWPPRYPDGRQSRQESDDPDRVVQVLAAKRPIGLNG
jgi:hypothetical protein